MRKTVIVAAAAFAVASGAMVGQAAAADLDFMPAPPPPVFVPTWQGFYIGGHLGYGEADFDVRQWGDIYWYDPNNVNADADGFLPGVLNTFRSSLSPDGLIGGVQGGYNWQAGSMVFGIEGDVSFADWGQSSATFDSLDGDVLGLRAGDEAWGSASADVDMLASVRGRVGFAMDSLLVYGTGGIAWADADARATVRHYDAREDVTRTLSGKSSFNDVGFVLGAGMGWMVIPQTFSVGIEGLYYFFDERKTLINETIVLENQDEIYVRATAKLDDAWVIRARADFHF